MASLQHTGTPIHINNFENLGLKKKQKRCLSYNYLAAVIFKIVCVNMGSEPGLAKVVILPILIFYIH